MAVPAQPVGREDGPPSQPEPASSFCSSCIGQIFAPWLSPSAREPGKHKGFSFTLFKVAHIDLTNLGVLPQKQNMVSSTILLPRGNH